MTNIISNTINTTSTFIPTGIGMTNYIRNVINIGGGSTACNAGTQYCDEGYSLYFPCLKDVTRGQEVCFDFYVTDNSTKDVADLNTVDAITLTLNGQYGCSYGTFSYPDNISSLQKDSYILTYSDDFNNRNSCHLSLVSIDVDEPRLDLYLNSKEGDFVANTIVEVKAYDTASHIFVGWMIPSDNGECDEETLNDYIVSTSHSYSFIIESDIKIFALYRPRKKYNVIVDPENYSSHYNVTYKTVTHHISNRPDEIFEDEHDGVYNVLEGYTLQVECIPNISTLDSDDDNDYSYQFVEWKDGVTKNYRIFHAGVDTQKFEEGQNIKLFSYCKVGTEESFEDFDPIIDYFDEEGIHIYTEDTVGDEYEYLGDEYMSDIENVYMKSDESGTYLHINNGRFTMTSAGIEDGIQVNVYASSNEPYALDVEVNGVILSQTVEGNDKCYEYYFDKCGGSDINISTFGECYIDKIELYKIDIVDKGKACLCLGPDTVIKTNEDGSTVTFKEIPTGPLSVSGAIMVNGQAFGLANTPIGKINKLNTITII